MNKLQKEFEERKQKIQKEIEVIEFYNSIMDPILENIPQDLLENNNLISIYPERQHNNALVMNVTVWLPYNPKLIKIAKRHLQDLDCVHIREVDSWNKADLNMYGEKYIDDKNYIDFTFLFIAKSKHSTCVLVPLEQTQTVTKEVRLYDRVCPDSHPDLFKKDEQGNYIYIGDNVFPALD